MRRNGLILTLLCAAGLAIVWTRAGTQGTLPAHGSNAGSSLRNVDLATAQGLGRPPYPGANSSPGARVAASRNQVAQNYGKLPLSFEPNAGQTDSAVKFLSRGPGYTLFLTSDQAVLRLKNQSAPLSPQEFMTRKSAPPRESRGGESAVAGQQVESVLSMRLIGANPRAMAASDGELPGVTNYLIGPDPQKWRTHIPTYARVKFANVYPGVDVVYYGSQSGELEYDFVVAPGADPSTIALSLLPGIQEDERDSKASGNDLTGSAAVQIARDGDLVVHLQQGDVRLHKPRVYQTVSLGTRQQSMLSTGEAQSRTGTPKGADCDRKVVDSRFTLDAQNRIRFALGPYDHTQPLYIDPILYYSTYLGGAVSDAGYAIAIDSLGDAYVAGATSSPNFPHATNSLNGASQDAFITELNPTGTAVIYYTYLGGSGADTAFGIAVDSAGNAYVTGSTYSGDFPNQNPLAGSASRALSTSFNGTISYVSAYGTGFVAELVPGGATLAFSTFFGGSNGTGIGMAGEVPHGIAIDPACTSSTCNIYLTGSTLSTDFPVTTNGFQPNPLPNNTQAAFVSKLNWNGSSLNLPYSTYLGGISDGDFDSGNAVGLDMLGHVYVTGQTISADFPVTANKLPAHDYGSSAYINGLGNAFISELDPNQSGPSSLLFSTFLGGNTGEGDSAQGLAIDPSGNIYVAGRTFSSDFPTVNPLPGTVNTTSASNAYASTVGTGFVAEINPAGPALVYSTYLGGSTGQGDSAQGIAVDGAGDAFVIGFTKSPDFPTVQNLTYSNGTAFPNSTLSGSSAAFASEIIANGGGLLLSSFLGGGGGDAGNAVAVNSSGDMFLTGSASSVNFPTAAPFIPPPMNLQDPVYQPHLGSNGAQTASQNAFIAMIQSAAFASISLSNLSYTFDNTPVNMTSADSAEPITVTNTGNAAAVFYSITIIADAGVNPLDFTQVNNCPTGSSTLAISAQCTISVTFHPTVAVREHAQLRIDDSASNGIVTLLEQPVQIVDLYGTGLLGVMITAQNKVYDATTAATTTCTPVGVAPADVGNVTCAAISSTFSDASVGNGKTVTATGITLGGGAAGNYALGTTTATTTANITPAPIVPSVTINNKTYDGTTAATIATRTLSGVLSGDAGNVVLTGGIANFSDPNVGNSKTVTVTGLGLSGGAAGNYALSPATATATANITPAPASVTPNAANKVYGAADPVFTGTLAGFLPADAVSAMYSRTLGQTVAGSPYTISATLSPMGVLGNYNVTYNTAQFTITPAALSITANSGSMNYGGAPPLITPIYSGFVNGDTSTSLATAPTCTTTATSTGPVGVYPSTCAGAVDSNYTITYVSGQVTINPAPLTITASSGSYTFGGVVPTITPGYSGFVNGQGAASLTSQPSCSTTATSSSPVASYPSTCAGAVDANYTIGYVNGKITENPAPLTITANSVSITAGSPMPTFTATYSGFVNGNTASNLAGTLVCTTTATNTNAAGTFPIACSGQSSPNYSITYVPGTLTITGSVNQGTPIARVSPVCVSFGKVLVGNECGSQPVTLTNIGTAPLAITSIALSGEDAADFTETTNCGSTLAPGASCTITVSFKPQAAGLETASLVITDNSNNIAGSQQVVGLSGVGLSQLKCDFNQKGIHGKHHLWFSGSMHPWNIDPNATTSFYMTHGTVTFAANHQDYTVNIPDGIVTFSPHVRTASTSFDEVNKRWVTMAPTWGINGSTFLSAVAYQVPDGGLPGSISGVTWSAAFSTDAPGASLTWQWAAAPYDTLPTLNDAQHHPSYDYNACHIKPVDDNHSCTYRDHENAGTPEGWQEHCRTGAKCAGSSNHTGDSCNPGKPICKHGPIPTPICVTAPPARCKQGSSKVQVPYCNRGSQPVHITGVKCTGDFQVDNHASGTMLQPGESCTLNVEFTPTQIGTRCGTLQVTDSSSNSPHVVNLGGEGE